MSKNQKTFMSLDPNDLPSYPTAYGGKEVSQALANAEVSAAIGNVGNTENPINFVDLGNKEDAATMPTGGVGLLGWVSGIWKLASDRWPILVGGRIPVDVSSLSVTVNNANLEISNDAGNPIPVNGSVGITFPTYDIYTTYHGTTNNVATITYKLGEVVVAAFDFNYVGGVPSTNNAKLLSMVKQ